MTAALVVRPSDTLADLARSAPSYEPQARGITDELRGLVPVEAYTDDEVASVVLNDVIKHLMRRDLKTILALHGLPFPRYPVDVSGSDEIPAPAFWDMARPLVPQTGWQVLGLNVGFPIGIPACELTSTPDWIEYYARQGFHILTFQTVRSQERRALRDWTFVDDVDQPWEPGQQPPDHVHSTNGPLPRDWRNVSTATPFAAPSPPPDVWRRQVEEARRRLDRLGGGHLLIVSITDSVDPAHKSDETLAEDFAKVAEWAEQAGAHAVECYLARSRRKDPRTGELQPCQFSASTSEAIVSAVRTALQPQTKIVAKLGDMANDALEAVVVPLAGKGYVDGISGISPVRVQVTRPGQPPLAENALPAIAGLAIRKLGFSFVERLAAIRRKHRLDFDIIGMGGVMTAEDVATYRSLGAAAVQTASAARSNPGLAAASYAWHRRASAAQSVDDWEGVVDSIEGDVFVATLVDVGGDAPDEEAQFDLHEVAPDQREEVKVGAVFRWRSEFVEKPNGEFVRRSSVRFRRLRRPSEEDMIAGKEFVEHARQAFVDSEPPPPLA